MKANKQSRLTRILIASVLALLFAGSGVATLTSALAVSQSAASIYLAAFAGIALCGLCAYSGGTAIAATLLMGVGGGVFVVSRINDFSAIPVAFARWSGGTADGLVAMRGARLLMLLAAFALGAVFFLAHYRRELASLAILLLGAIIISSHAMSTSASVAASVPGLVGALSAFALTGSVQRDRMAARVLIPSALAVCAALLLTPQSPDTWKPLEDAAERVRSAFEQYFNFTRERIAFSINEQGYDHAGEVDDNVVAMLGGPAQPKDAAVMRVRADRNVLLRGAIRATYTGYSWVDVTPKNRYLFIDPTHLITRRRVFNLDFDQKGFEQAEISVEFLAEGTSTLFVPGRVRDFDMDIVNAVYYNTSGEMFMARPVEPGDQYRLTAMLPTDAASLRAAAVAAQNARDGQYEGIVRDYTGLPEGVEAGLYDLVAVLTAGLDAPCDKALAIQEYLRQNMRYTLAPDYPPAGRDFASYFVLESREGYCSYYATAMAVMARIAGLPARYVEGYLARAERTGEVVLTGYDAHAWAEIYFSGLGWVPFDATGGAIGAGEPDEDGDAQGDDGEDPDDAEGEVPADGEEDKQPDDGAEDSESGEDSPESQPPEPTPTPEPRENPGAQDAPEFFPEEENEPFPDTDDSSERGGAPWPLMLILALLLLIALAVLWTRRRLAKASPAALVSGTRSAQEAAMILYRANLTALSALGHWPAGGESPEAFAARVCGELKNDDFMAFAAAVASARYGKKPLGKADIETGLRAYAGFTRRMGRAARLRYGLRRMFHGLGRFDQIP